MSEHIVFEGNDTPFKWLLIEAFAIAVKNNPELGEKLVASATGGNGFNVTVTINGIEVPFEQACNEGWERSFDKAVEECARDLITGRLNKIHDMVSNFEEHVRNEVDKVIPTEERW